MTGRVKDKVSMVTGEASGSGKAMDIAQGVVYLASDESRVRIPDS